MKFYITFLICLLCVGCEFKPYAAPGSEMTYNGVYLTEKKSLSDKKIKEILMKSCNKIKCKVINNRFLMDDGDGFFLIIVVDKNEEIWLTKDTRNVIFFTIIQKSKSKFNDKTLSVLENLKDMGFEFKLIHLEEWVCNGEKLTFENCTRKETKYNNLDYIEFVKSNLA